jgi:hypothetical protein
VHHFFEDYDNVKFLIAFSDADQPYTCREWGLMPEGGATQIITDEVSTIWGLFESGGAFPSSVLLNHEMMVYAKNPSPFSLDDIIPELIENIPDQEGLLGDINGDEILNVLDVILIVNMALGNADIDLNGDMNSDGGINVLDIVLLVNIILN